jgi:hypothetical protein
MTGIKPLLEQIEIDLRNSDTGNLKTIYLNIYDNSLSRKWLATLESLLTNNYHLEKNYCFLGFTESFRTAEYILDQLNYSIRAINQANLGYEIDDHFTIDNTVDSTEPGPFGRPSATGRIYHDKFNNLHRYFEDLQGISGAISPYYQRADSETRWHIRQLNLLCHEFESLALSLRKLKQAPDWVRPSQLMCWLNAPRFTLESADLELFGIETINRPMGGVFVGVNKAVGKHHWEVFIDEGRDSRLSELTTTTLRSQTQATGDFDIEWGRNPGQFDFQKEKLNDFSNWLINNGFDPTDKSLTIGHPQVGQVDLIRSFGTQDHWQIWAQLSHYLDVFKIRTSVTEAIYDYNWSDSDYMNRQIRHLSQGN